ncbi:alkaline phosphatase [Bythopirellula polymerisocia]|uniref:Alkaline phosphatase 3 n=1 Tax=Bythopirellula polymerisocia TaxID=2528003 RepID=A0A5C6CXR2_9BACT|nr:alkaline phosphatase [Bythopirellula polymerisocia]TWU28261.1 Alkaline phosphatase 3 precursor [Bythopirellula polymerisocia]
MRLAKFYSLMCLLAVCWSGYAENLRGEEIATELESPQQAILDSSLTQAESIPQPKIRNVILMIGDGMGPQQLGLLFAYARHAGSSQVPEKETAEKVSAIEQLATQGNVGIVRTNPHGALVVDSAAAATQLATGASAGSEMIGVDYKGNRAETVLEVARDSGKSTGLVSDTRMTHATPAAFAAHQRHRSMENEIAVDMLENKVDVLMSGGLRHWVPQAVNKKDSAAYMALVQMIGGAFDPYSKREDNRNLLLEARGDYQLVFDRSALEKVTEARVLGLFANSEMLDAIGERKTLATGVRTEPTLVEMTKKSLEILNKNPQGFFLMVEGGQIDWAGHNNDAGDMLWELLQFDDAVRNVFEWASKRDDTLVLVTADHETGSFGFSYSGYEIPEPQTLGGNVFGEELFAPNFSYGPPHVLNALAAQQKSYFEIFTEFDSLPTEERTAEKLLAIVNEAVQPLSITLADATELLNRMANQYYQKGHPYLGTPTLPQIPDQEAFFVYGENLRMNRLGHILGKQQAVVWGTGTHTSTPVMIAGFGPESERFTGILHATDVGKRMIEIIRGK